MKGVASFFILDSLFSMNLCHSFSLLLQVFPHKKNHFPRPAIILSDRAQVFLQAALRVFNEESFDQFLARAYRIVTNHALPDDITKTNIHACLAHFMLVSVTIPSYYE